LTVATGCRLPFESSVLDESVEPVDDPEPVGLPPPPVPPAVELLELELEPLVELLDPEPVVVDVVSPVENDPENVGGVNLVVVVGCVVVVDSVGSVPGFVVGGNAFVPVLPETAALVCAVSRTSPITAKPASSRRTGCPSLTSVSRLDRHPCTASARARATHPRAVVCRRAGSVSRTVPDTESVLVRPFSHE
jgi:hypothetical protein